MPSGATVTVAQPGWRPREDRRVVELQRLALVLRGGFHRQTRWWKFPRSAILHFGRGTCRLRTRPTTGAHARAGDASIGTCSVGATRRRYAQRPAHRPRRGQHGCWAVTVRGLRASFPATTTWRAKRRTPCGDGLRCDRMRFEARLASSWRQAPQRSLRPRCVGLNLVAHRDQLRLFGSRTGNCTVRCGRAASRLVAASIAVTWPRSWLPDLPRRRRHRSSLVRPDLVDRTTGVPAFPGLDIHTLRHR